MSEQKWVIRLVDDDLVRTAVLTLWVSAIAMTIGFVAGTLA